MGGHDCDVEFDPGSFDESSVVGGKDTEVARGRSTELLNNCLCHNFSEQREVRCIIDSSLIDDCA